MNPNNRLLAGFVKAVCDAHEMPLLALVGRGTWQIVTDEGNPLGDAAKTPYEAWKSAAERLKGEGGA